MKMKNEISEKMNEFEELVLDINRIHGVVFAFYDSTLYGKQSNDSDPHYMAADMIEKLICEFAENLNRLFIELRHVLGESVDCGNCIDAQDHCFAEDK